MAKRSIVALLIGIAVFPLSADANVRINEVAWMGTDEGGASCEWIELVNDTSDIVNLVGWTLSILNSGGSTPKVLNLGDEASVKYSGIAGDGFYLIARDSGACKNLSPATAADWLGSFGTGVSNTGATLTLFNGSTEVDEVDAIAGWTTSGIGGKNTSGQPKQTPQRMGNGWTTATPTPRSPNALPPVDELPDEEATTTPPVVTIGGTAPLVPLIHPISDLRISAIPARIVSVGAETPFTAVVYDSTGNMRSDADVRWTFGDGGADEGENVMYTYLEEGQYLATARAKVKGASAISVFDVIVSRAEVSIETVSEQGITLRNASNRLVDLSSWKLKSGRRTFTIPDDTVIGASRTTLFPWGVTRLSTSTDPVLLYPNSVPVP